MEVMEVMGGGDGGDGWGWGSGDATAMDLQFCDSLTSLTLSHSFIFSMELWFWL